MAAARHHLDQLHHKGFEQQRETAARPGPRNGDSMDAAAAALHPGSASVEVGFMLEEVQMLPGYPAALTRR